jgi:rSAM/selenodomain-associated transferase 2
MRAPVSVVIPTLNAEAALPACLAALTEGLQAGLIRELIFSDGGSTDATLRIAEAAGAMVVTGPPSRGGQLRRGVAASGGAWVLVLHADTVLARGWTEAVSCALTTSDAYYFRLRYDAEGIMARVVAGWANLRSRLFRLPYGDQGLLISAELYAQVGGYPDIPLMEDVALACALNGRMKPLGALAVTSAAKYQAQGWLRRGARNLTLLARFLAGADPERLARAYRR